MLVKDLIELIGDYEELIIRSNGSSRETWQGKSSCLPSKYMNHEITLILSTIVKYNNTGIIICIEGD